MNIQSFIFGDKDQKIYSSKNNLALHIFGCQDAEIKSPIILDFLTGLRENSGLKHCFERDERLSYLSILSYKMRLAWKQKKYVFSKCTVVMMIEIMNLMVRNGTT